MVEELQRRLPPSNAVQLHVQGDGKANQGRQHDGEAEEDGKLSSSLTAM